MAYIENEKEMRHKKSDYENDWAKDIKGEPIHINNAKSGLQGYYCLGCDKEMQGVKFKNPKYQSYFRHHAKNINQEKEECVVASKTYRERLAESILNRLKFVKTPAVFKYPPKGVEGVPMLLQKSKIITASYTKAQEWFYEEADGSIKWGKNPQIEDRYLLIRPDVTLFDAKDKPILFVEFVITHKLTTEKKVKLSRIGINTVQIIIPKKPGEEIEKALKSSRKYKWVYNELEANTTYISIPQGNTEGIPPINEEQRRLFEESFSCRAAKINNLVRNINKCLRSESYRRIERLFKSELSRVAGNRKAAEQRLGELEEQYRTEALEKNRELEEGIKEEQKDLERRYTSKAKQLREDTEGAEQRLGNLEESYRREALERNQGEEESIDTGRQGIEKLYTNLEGRYLRKEASYRKLYEGCQEQLLRQSEDEAAEGLRQEIKNQSKAIISTRETFKEPRSSEIDRIRKDINSEGKRTEDIRGYIAIEEGEIRRIEQEENNLEESIREELRRGVNENSPGLSSRIKTLLEVQRVASNFEDSKRENNRYQKARELFNKRAWEKG